jgi:hypothetical protein
MGDKSLQKVLVVADMLLSAICVDAPAPMLLVAVYAGCTRCVKGSRKGLVNDAERNLPFNFPLGINFVTAWIAAARRKLFSQNVVYQTTSWNPSS